MKKSELKQIIKEEIGKVLNEIKIGDKATYLYPVMDGGDIFIESTEEIKSIRPNHVVFTNGKVIKKERVFPEAKKYFNQLEKRDSLGNQKIWGKK
jgi:hypothetical protein